MRLCAKSGLWYPAPKELSSVVPELLRKVNTKVQPVPNLCFVISPHAGMAYSGLTAAHSYASIDPTQYTSVVMLGVCHSIYQSGLSVTPFATWANPLTTNGAPSLVMDPVPGLPACNKDGCSEEHSLELQIPFLAHIFADQIAAKMVKFAAVYCSHNASRADLDKLKDYIVENNSLIVVSSDFCHYGPRFQFTPIIKGKTANEVVTALDNQCINAIMVGADAFEKTLEETQSTVCGHYTIKYCLSILEKLRYNLKKELLFYTKSDEPMTAHDHSVSYVSMRGTREP